MSDDSTRIADALVKLAGMGFVTWRQAMITGGTLLVAVVTGLGLIFASHSAQPHPNAVTQAEFDRTLTSIAADLSTIRKDVRELRGTKKGG